jgi:hypothetical protein
MPAAMQTLLVVLIEERNKVVLRDLELALHRRPLPDSVALFYGAGHMPDLETRLQETLHYRPSGERWFTAIAVNPRAAGMSTLEVELVRGLVRQQMDALQSQGN